MHKKDMVSEINSIAAGRRAYCNVAAVVIAAAAAAVVIVQEERE
jgi:hypothetical protein